eukprot:gene30074-54260_t
MHDTGEREAQAEAQARRSKNRQRELREEIQNVEERIEIEKQVSRELREHLSQKTTEVGHSTKKWSDKQNESTRREDEVLAFKNNEKKDLE